MQVEGVGAGATAGAMSGARRPPALPGGMGATRATDAEPMRGQAPGETGFISQSSHVAQSTASAFFSVRTQSASPAMMLQLMLLMAMLELLNPAEEQDRSGDPMAELLEAALAFQILSQFGQEGGTSSVMYFSASESSQSSATSTYGGGDAGGVGGGVDVMA